MNNDDGYNIFNDSLPIRTELTVLPADPPPRSVHSLLHKIVINARGKCGKRKPPGTLGWSVTEKIGIAIVNPRALKSLSKSVVVGK